MHNLILPGVIGGIFFITSVTLFFIAITKRNKTSIYFSLLFFLLAVGAGIWFGWVAITKLHIKVRETLKPRSGIEIYKALFGKPANDCVRVTEYQDQVMPRLDDGIRLKFETCPAEVRRILQQRSYRVDTITRYNSMETKQNDNRFDVQSLGAGARVYKYENPGRNWQTIYISADSGKAICIDIAD